MKKYLGLFKQAVSEFSADKVPRLGAALAYYTIFSLAPLLLIVIAIAGLAFGHDAAQGKIFEQLRGFLGTTAAAAMQEMVKNAAKPKTGTIATILGVVTLLLGASGVFGQLKDALNTIWDVKPKEGRGIMGLIKDRFLSFSMVFGLGFLLLVSLVIDTAIAAMGKYAGNHLPGGEALWHIVELLFSFCVITVLMAGIFRLLPDLKIEWRDVWLGAALTSILFVLGKFALGIYFAKSAVGSSFGAAGSLVLVLLWVYYSAQILLFGAEFTQVYARSHGSLKAEADAKRTEKEKEERTPAPSAKPVVVYKTAPSKGGGAGVAKMAAGGVAGLLIGALVGGISATIVVVKSVKKLFTL
ncbi:MAG TPA: YihY/virulence factor BrkB family protein [Thermoanaerobaculia bacterium]|jgi:membrane protein|nr:YihY/virulence factor BrkB family protein [Thermoanaerobaculia bacterium]